MILSKAYIGDTIVYFDHHKNLHQAIVCAASYKEVRRADTHTPAIREWVYVVGASTHDNSPLDTVEESEIVQVVHCHPVDTTQDREE